jgi:hypothetical protein
MVLTGEYEKEDSGSSLQPMPEELNIITINLIKSQP